MVRDAVFAIQAIGLVKSVDHLRNSVGTNDDKRFGPPCDPGIEIELRKGGKVIGVKVSQKYCLEAFQRKLAQCRGSRRARSNIDEIEGISSEDSDTSLGTPRIR